VKYNTEQLSPVASLISVSSLKG